MFTPWPLGHLDPRELQGPVHKKVEAVCGEQQKTGRVGQRVEVNLKIPPDTLRSKHCAKINLGCPNFIWKSLSIKIILRNSLKHNKSRNHQKLSRFL